MLREDKRAHIAMQQADDATVVTRGEHVSDADYGQAPPIGGYQTSA